MRLNSNYDDVGWLIQMTAGAQQVWRYNFSTDVLVIVANYEVCFISEELINHPEV